MIQYLITIKVAIIKYTQKQIDKYNRQKYINELEKIGKNLFKMFRDRNIGATLFIKKFDSLIEKFEAKEEVHLDSEYHKELKSYIYRLKVELNSADDAKLDDIRDMQMSNLNRLQKLKNRINYKKDKHKLKTQNQDWG